MKSLNIMIKGGGRNERTRFDVERVACAGFTGRDRESVRMHIHELEEMGVTAPASTPTVYWVSPDLLTNSSEINVESDMTSGEVEFVLLFGTDSVYLTVGSDHTDRRLEASDIQKSKEACPKVIAQEAWSLGDVEQHMDKIALSSSAMKDGEWVAYQSGHISDFMTPGDIVQRVGGRSAGLVLFCGTLPILGGRTIFADAFRIEISDPVLNRSISGAYRVGRSI